MSVKEGEVVAVSLVYFPLLLAARYTVYPVAPLTFFHVSLMEVEDAALAVTSGVDSLAVAATAALFLLFWAV